MAETTDIDDLITKATAVLLPLTETEPPRSRSQSKTDLVLEAVKPIILQARAKRHGFKQISELLKSTGVFVSSETLRRRFPNTRSEAVTSSNGNTKKKKSSSTSAPRMAAQTKAPVDPAPVKTESTAPAPVATQPITRAPATSTPTPPTAHAGARRAKV